MVETSKIIAWAEAASAVFAHEDKHTEAQMLHAVAAWDHNIIELTKRADAGDVEAQKYVANVDAEYHRQPPFDANPDIDLA